MSGEGLGRRIRHRKNVRDKLLEEFTTGILLVDASGRLSGRDDFRKMQPFRNQVSAGVANQSALKTRLRTNQEGGALRRERVKSLVVFLQQIEADKNVHDGRKASDRCSGRFVHLLDVLWASIQHVEDALADRGFNDKGRNITPGKLHDALRRN